MTDRAQPGAQGSTLRNIEAGESSQTLSDGFVVPANEPTLSSQRYADLDESQYNAFSASYSDTSLDVTINAGEAFVKGWLARDTNTTVTLDSFTNGQTVVVAWDADAVYDDSIHADREEADRVIITREADLPTTPVPYIPIWEFDTDGSGVTDARDIRSIGVGYYHEQVDNEPDQTGNMVLQAGGREYDSFIIEYTARTGSNSQFDLRINGDDSSGNYNVAYNDTEYNLTKNTGEDFVDLIDWNTTFDYAYMRITGQRLNPADGWAFSVETVSIENFNITQFADSFNWQVDDAIETIEIYASDARSGNEATLYGR